MSEPRPVPPPGRPTRRWPVGCLYAALGAAALGVAAVAGGVWWWQARQLALAEAQQAHADEVFAPALAMLEAPARPDYDIDATIRVVHEIDQALAQEDSLDDWLRHAATRDHRGVAPEVLEARREVLGILQTLYARQTEADDQRAVWELTGELLLSTLSVVSVQGEAGMTGAGGALQVDRKQAQSLLDDMKDEQRERTRLLREVDDLEADLFDALDRYAAVYWDYVEEWDQLSVLRDRAWLAVAAGDWEAARAAADLAVAKAPHDEEAHLVAAMARIEGGTEEDWAQAGALLGAYVEEHPDHAAPALLLLGVLHERRGDGREARLAFQQAAAYYPRQAEGLEDELDPYRIRAYLRRSREGGTIVEQYRTMMSGAGYFSPDLQLARALFDEGDDDAARGKVLDHFARRRAQGQWDFVLSDLTFCQDLLGPDYRSIFPEDAWLDLEVTPTMLGHGLNLAVRNRSEATLHNATLVLALHLTDMVPGDYQAMAAGPTVPAVLAHDTTSFGAIDPELQVDGSAKTLDDVVFHRAILVTNEAVVWVDTDAYRIAEAEAFRQRRAAGSAPSPEVARFPELSARASGVLAEAQGAATFEIDRGYGADDIVVRLPRSLAALRPVFRLQAGDQLVLAKDNVIEGDAILLRFADVANFDGEHAPAVVSLVVQTPWGEVSWPWTP